MIYVYLIIFLSFYPFPITSEINISPPDIVTFIGFFYAVIWRRHQTIKIVKEKLFFPYAIIVVLFVAISNLSNTQNDVGLGPVFKYITYCIFFPILLAAIIRNEINLYGTEVFIANFIKNLCIFGLFFCVILISLILIGQANQDELGNIYIYEYHKNASGALLFLAANFGIISIILYKFWPGYITVLLALIILILTGSRAYFIASIGFLISCSFIQNSDAHRIAKRITALFLFTLLLFILGWIIAPELFSSQAERFGELMVSSDEEINSANSRFILWAIAIDDLLQNPIFGVGYGGFNPDLGGFFEDITEPHNAILQIASQGGILGLSAFTIILVNALRLANKDSSPLAVKYIRNTLIFYIVASMFGIIWVRGDGHIFWMLFWFATLLSNDISERNKEVTDSTH